MGPSTLSDLTLWWIQVRPNFPPLFSNIYLCNFGTVYGLEHIGLIFNNNSNFTGSVLQLPMFHQTTPQFFVLSWVIYYILCLLCVDIYFSLLYFKSTFYFLEYKIIRSFFSRSMDFLRFIYFMHVSIPKIFFRCNFICI